MTNIKYERENITRDHKDIKRIIRKFYEKLYPNNFDSIDEMSKFFGSLPKKK